MTHQLQCDKPHPKAVWPALKQLGSHDFTFRYSQLYRTYTNYIYRLHRITAPCNIEIARLLEAEFGLSDGIGSSYSVGAEPNSWRQLTLRRSGALVRQPFGQYDHTVDPEDKHVPTTGEMRQRPLQ